MSDLASNSSYHADLEEMRRRLDEWMRRTDDPLLHGAVKAPAGAQLNPVTETSPSDPVQVTP